VILAGPLPHPRAMFDKARLAAKGDSLKLADSVDSALALAASLLDRSGA
jgi:hypothetical protein